MDILNSRIRIVKQNDVENPYRLKLANDPKIYFQISHRIRDIDRFNEFNDFSLGITIKPPEGCYIQLYPSFTLAQAGYDMFPQIIHFDPDNHNEVMIRLRKIKDNEDLSTPFFNGVYGLVYKNYNNDIHIETTINKIDDIDKPNKAIGKMPKRVVYDSNKNDYLF